MLSVVALMHTHMLTQIHLDTENKRERERDREQSPGSCLDISWTRASRPKRCAPPLWGFGSYKLGFRVLGVPH